MKSSANVSIVLIVFVALISGCARLPENTDRSASFAYATPETTQLGDGVSRILEDHPGDSAYVLLANGLDAFVARAVLAQLAEKTIDAQYYLLHDDLVGRLFIDQLLKAADRGVRVRLLVDDMDMGGRDFGAAIVDSHPNIEVRFFNPFGRNTFRSFQFLTGFGRQTRRSHNKSFTVDNAATILGGRNIGNEYFVADPELEFLDLDVLALGPVAMDVSASFDLYWNHQLSYPIAVLTKKLPTEKEARALKREFDNYITEQDDSPYLRELRNSAFANALRNRREDIYSFGKGSVFADNPSKLINSTSDTAGFLSTELAPYLENTTKELLIISPYFVPGDTGVAFFKSLRDKGVRVTILTNSLSSNDVSIVHAGYAKYRKALLRMGVELYELNMNLRKELKEDKEKGKFYQSRSSLHAKSFVIDRQKVFIGSLNLDPRSVIQNTEIGIIVESDDIANELGEFFDSYLATLAFRLELKTNPDGWEHIVWHGLVDGKQTTLNAEPYTSFWDRFITGFLKILPIESQL